MAILSYSIYISCKEKQYHHLCYKHKQPSLMQPTSKLQCVFVSNRYRANTGTTSCRPPSNLFFVFRCSFLQPQKFPIYPINSFLSCEDQEGTIELFLLLHLKKFTSCIGNAILCGTVMFFVNVIIMLV
jgi:hypothetical protein